MPNPFPTNTQSIPFRFLLNRNAISNSEKIPKIPLKIEFIVMPDVSSGFGIISAFVRVRLIPFSFRTKDIVSAFI